MKAAVVAIALALSTVMAGCAGPKDEPAVERQSLSPAQTAGSPGAAAEENASHNATSAAALSLFLHPDGTLARDAAAAGARAVGVPVNGPLWEDHEYPTWTGTLAEDVTIGPAVPVRVFATTTSVAVAANNAPPFAHLPGIEVHLFAGDARWGVEIPGPATMTAAEVVEFRGELSGKEAVLPAGTEVTLLTIVYYTHATAAEEFRILMGPDHPSGLG